MAFTTWTAELRKLETALADRDPSVQSYTIGGRTILFRSAKELQEHYRFVKSMAANEQGTGFGRSSAGQGGTGRW